MIEELMEKIARFISNFFRRAGEKVEDSKLEYNMSRTQMKDTKANVKSMLKVSVSEKTTINYFENRVIGELLKLVSYVVEYKYEAKTKTYVAYLVRRKKKNTMEYIKFYKYNEQDTDANITYTLINRIISNKGVTVDIGNTKDTNLVVTPEISRCLYDSITPDKAPLYLVHVLNDEINIGNPKYVYECWVLMCKVISNKVERYRVDVALQKQVDKLVDRAGIHLFMSYFKTTNNPFYKKYYSYNEINDLLGAVIDYNSRHFNTNKILDFYYDGNNKTKGIIKSATDKSISHISLYGVNIKVSPALNSNTDINIKSLNYKFANVLLKSEYKEIRDNFLFFIYSTGGIDDEDIIELKEQELFGKNKYTDDVINEMNNTLEKDVETIMSESGFTEGENGEYSSEEFKSYIDALVEDLSNSNDTSYPTAEYIVYEPVREPLFEEQEEYVSPTKEEVKETTVEDDIVKRLEVDATGRSTVSNEDTKSNLVDSIVEEEKSIEDIIKIPLIQWTKEDCVKMIGTDMKLENISKQDIFDRMMFLSEKK